MVGRPYSEEFRRRVLEEVAEGNSRRGAARRFKVGASSAIRWKKRLDTTGSAAPAPRAGKSRSPLEAHAPWLLALIAAEPDLSLAELTQRVQAELGQKTSASAMDRFVQRHELSFRNVWPAPSASDFVECAFFSLLQRIRPRADAPAKMEIRAFGSSQNSRRRAPFLNQVSRTPFDCQAISLPPLANIVSRSAHRSRASAYSHAAMTAPLAEKACRLRSTAQQTRASLSARATTATLG